MKSLSRGLGLLVVALSTMVVNTPQSAGARPAAVDEPSAPAWFDGRPIDLRAGWGEAAACNVVAAGTYCYRSEAELLAHQSADLARPAAEASAVGSTSSLTNCSSATKLYDSTSYTGAAVYLSTRGTIINLAGVAFDNRTSSYKIGACATDLFSGIGSGVYPGPWAAGSSSASMLSGWNNTLSSALLY